MPLSKHAQDRCQQRAIQPLIVDWLIRHGHRVPVSGGALVCHFDKRSRKALSALYGHRVVDQLASLLDTYIVLGMGDQVITAGHRYRRIRQ